MTALHVLDLVGIFVFGITGALVGVRKKLDVFGVLVLALVTGLGGGFLRDVLIGATPPAALNDWRYLTVPIPALLGAGIVVVAAALEYHAVWVPVAAAATCFVIRLVAIRGWNAPLPRNP